MQEQLELQEQLQTLRELLQHFNCSVMVFDCLSQCCDSEIFGKNYDSVTLMQAYKLALMEVICTINDLDTAAQDIAHRFIDFEPLS